MTNEEALKILSLKSTNLPYDEQNNKLFDAVLIAIGSIIKQIPKKPIKKPYDDECLYYYETCPNCGEETFWSEVRTYCPYCGQAIDWS